MWAGIIVIGVVIALFLLARLVLSGSFGRLRTGDRPPEKFRDGYGGGPP
jgi:hypothetical protein